MDRIGRSRISLLLTALAAAGLGYDAYVHLHLAANYDAVGSTITQGWLFRVEAAAAIAAVLALFTSDHRLAWAFAGTVGLGGLVAVVLYRYVDVPSFSPIPRMYEPIWYAEKTRSAIAEGGVAVVWILREILRRPVSSVRSRAPLAAQERAGPG